MRGRAVVAVDQLLKTVVVPVIVELLLLLARQLVGRRYPVVRVRTTVCTSRWRPPVVVVVLQLTVSFAEILVPGATVGRVALASAVGVLTLALTLTLPRTFTLECVVLG